jgi:hypothetical protein
MECAMEAELARRLVVDRITERAFHAAHRDCLV